MTQDSVELAVIVAREGGVAGRGWGEEAHLREDAVCDKSKACSSHHYDRIHDQIGLRGTILGLPMVPANRHTRPRPSECKRSFRDVCLHIRTALMVVRMVRSCESHTRECVKRTAQRIDHISSHRLILCRACAPLHEEPCLVTLLPTVPSPRRDE